MKQKSRILSMQFFLCVAVAAVIALAVMVPSFFSMRESMKAREILEECRVQLAVYSQAYESGVEAISANFDKSWRMLEAAVRAGGSVLEAGLTPEEMTRCLEETELFADLYLAVGDQESVLMGDLPTSAFRAVLPDFDAEEKNHVFDETGRCWALYRGADGITVIGKTKQEITSSLISENVGVSTMMADLELPEHYAILRVMTEDRSILERTGDFPLEPGDILPEISPDGRYRVNGRMYLGVSVEIDGVQRICLADEMAESSGTHLSPVLAAGVYTLVLILLSLYACFLMSDYARGRMGDEKKTVRIFRFSLPQGIVTRLRNLFATAMVLAVLFNALGIWLTVSNAARVQSEKTIESMKKSIVLASSQETAIGREEWEPLWITAGVLNRAMGEKPTLKSPEGLKKLAASVGGKLFLLDAKGNVEAGSDSIYDFTGINVSGETWNYVMPVLEGKLSRAGFSHPYESENCFALRQEDGNGALVVILPKSAHSSDYDVTDLYAQDDQLILSVQDGTIASSSVSALNGKPIAAVGLTADIVRDGFAGQVRLMNDICFLTVSRVEIGFICVASDMARMLLPFLPLLLWQVLIGTALVTLLLTGLLFIYGKKWEQVQPGPEELSDDINRFYQTTGHHLRIMITATGRLSQVKRSFRDLYADEKIGQIVRELIVVCLCAFFIAINLPGSSQALGSTAAYLVSMRWEKNINAYSVTYAMILVAGIFTVSFLVRKLVMMIGSNFSSRGETIARMLDSFLRYASVIGAAIYSLQFFGVNTNAILASVGIVGLGLSLGSKDLVADILAGISIVFEGEFRAGDIIEVGGYRGTVQEIGIRTTKVVADGNVKIFRNSAVGAIVNMTQHYSVAEVKLDVARSVPLEQIEDIFRRNLKEISSHIPDLQTDIVLLGVVGIGSDSVSLSFTGQCEERAKRRVTRAMYRELNILMSREGLKARG